jgi:WbqC-like protein
MAADIFVYLDSVQFSKNGLQNRNQIKGGQGALWLTVPVKHKLGVTILETEVADPKATRKHWKTLQANYSQSAGFIRWHDDLARLFEANETSLAKLTITSTEWMLQRLDVKTERIRASEMLETHGHASKLVASICKELGATTYLTGAGALEYLDADDFEVIGCAVEVQQWQKFNYEQQHKTLGFVPDLSALDLLLNVPDQAAELITAAGSWKPLK